MPTFKYFGIPNPYTLCGRITNPTVQGTWYIIILCFYWCPGKSMRTSIDAPIHRLPWRKAAHGAYLKSRRDERPQTGAQAPGSSATIKEAPKGRQRPKHVVIKHVTCSVALSGLSFVNALVPGVTPPSVVFRAFGAYSADSNNTYPFAS